MADRGIKTVSEEEKSYREQFEMDSMAIGYFGLIVETRDGKHYWSVLDHDGYTCEEIPESLFNELKMHIIATEDETS